MMRNLPPLCLPTGYQMRGKYKAYLIERFENFGTVETKDVFVHLANNVYTIEHIMPQHLTPAWTEALGPNMRKFMPSGSIVWPI